MGKAAFSKKIISWYLENQRDLPWRRSKDPYRIWLSEVILQQTRVAQGLPYYHAFIRNFPNVKALSKASQQQVLRIWQGLGYYSRARNLHACAKEIVGKHNQRFPSSYDELIKLPGIGPYTAAAIASIAFNQPVAVVDGNVFRVLSRVFGIHEDIGSGEGKKLFATKAQKLIDPERPGDFNQAIMEFGALYCTPQNPNCSACIFSNDCYANRHSLQDALPIKLKKTKVRTRHFNYLVLTSGNKVALKKRAAKDIWNGLFDFFLVEGRKSLTQLTSSGLPGLESIQIAEVHKSTKTYKHVLSHQVILAKFFIMVLKPHRSLKASLKKSGLVLFSPEETQKLPKPVLISRFLNENGLLE